MKNNKGFTLIELIGVIVILGLVLLIAIPNIVSTYERNKNKINEQKTEIILDAAEMYVNLLKNHQLQEYIYDYDYFMQGTCGIEISSLIKEDLITEEDLKDSEGNEIYSNTDLIFYDKDNGVYSIYKTENNNIMLICYPDPH